jgi:predicted nucleic acid-binding protein
MLVAAIDQNVRQHGAATTSLADRSYDLVIPALCVAEAAYLIERDHGPLVEAAFIEGLSAFEVIAPEPEDWARIAALVRQYGDFPIGTTDASIVALAERLETDTIMTFDRRHFGAIVPAQCPAFRLLPE